MNKEVSNTVEQAFHNEIKFYEVSTTPVNNLNISIEEISTLIGQSLSEL